MNLYVVRHGDALSELQDPSRPLSERGHDELQALAASLAPHLGAAEIWHSGKTRAEQSAQILQSTALPDARLQMREGLNPNDDVEALALTLRHENRDLVIVGHLPYVSRLTSLLTCGDPNRVVYLFETGGAVALHRRGANWCVRWMLDPRLLEPTRA